MKIRLIIWILCGLVSPSALDARLPEVSPTRRISLFTDREVYIPGEMISFSAQLNHTDTSCISKVLYIEFISPDGTAFIQAKYPVTGFLSSGSLQIPADLISGNYYLKAYTRFDRNFGPSAYAYVPVMVVNPYSRKVLEGNIRPASTDTPVAEENGIRIIQDKKEYNTRDSIVMKFIPGAGAGMMSEVCLTVVLEAAFPSRPGIDRNRSGAGSPGNFNYEESGIALTGRVVFPGVSSGIASKRVNLSIPDEKDFVAVNTDSSGRFAFMLPFLDGSRDLFLSTAKTGTRKTEILVDNDFDHDSPELPALVFEPSEAEEELALLFTKNLELRDRFFTTRKDSAGTSATTRNSFYGTPSYVLNIGDYIELPNLEEYFNELSLPAHVRKAGDRKIFRFYSIQADMVIHDPLVLIDWIAIDDEEKIMAISSAKIDRIEFVDAPYVKGDLTYGGIISVISKSGDFGGIDLPSSGIFLNYGFFHESTRSVAPPIENEGTHFPDLRNTLAWEPVIHCKAGVPVKYSFTAGDTKGNYIVLIRGTDSEGKVIHGVSSFLIK